MSSSDPIDRRDFLRLAGIGGVVFASALPGCAQYGTPRSGRRDFSFVQLSDIHWGYSNPRVNPEPRQSLVKAIAAVNALEQPPDFIVFTGDLTQTTDDPAVRRARMREFRDLAGGLKHRDVRFMHGEHDAALDRAEAFQEVFGTPLYSSFDHEGVHFVMLDNTSQPAPVLGDAQLDWLRSDLARQSTETPIVVLTHRPLFALYPQWDWATRDGDRAIELLSGHRYVSVFYGHIHHEHRHTTGRIVHHAATSTMFPLSPVGTEPQKTQLPWDPAQPFKGLGARQVAVAGTGTTTREMSLGAA